MRILGYGLLIVLLMSGCVRRISHIPLDSAEDNETRPTGTLYDTSRTEAKYSLRPEPYSVSSNEKDPELLGPQRTITQQKNNNTVQVATVSPASKPSSSAKSSMTKEACISMIGQTKFDRYSKRFGGESGAIKRCAILKKLKHG